jgi:hypothetical protein
MRRLACTCIAFAALAVPATAAADDHAVLAAYQSKAATLKGQTAKIVKLTRRWRHHRSAGPRVVRVLKRQRVTLFQVAVAVQAAPPSSPSGVTAKDLCVKALTAYSRSDMTAIRAFVAARHNRFHKSARQFRTATKQLKKAHRFDHEAGVAFHAAGVL